MQQPNPDQDSSIDERPMDDDELVQGDSDFEENDVEGTEDDQDEAIDQAENDSDDDEPDDDDESDGESEDDDDSDSQAAATGGAASQDLEELVRYVAGKLVHNAEDITVSSEFRGGTVYVSLRVPEEEMGRVIGREGRTAKAIRTLVSIAGNRHNVHARLDIDG